MEKENNLKKILSKKVLLERVSQEEKLLKNVLFIKKKIIGKGKQPKKNVIKKSIIGKGKPRRKIIIKRRIIRKRLIGKVKPE